MLCNMLCHKTRKRSLDAALPMGDITQRAYSDRHAVTMFEFCRYEGSLELLIFLLMFKLFSIKSFEWFVLWLMLHTSVCSINSSISKVIFYIGIETWKMSFRIAEIIIKCFSFNFESMILQKTVCIGIKNSCMFCLTSISKIVVKNQLFWIFLMQDVNCTLQFQWRQISQFKRSWRKPVTAWKTYVNKRNRLTNFPIKIAPQGQLEQHKSSRPIS